MIKVSAYTSTACKNFFNHMRQTGYGTEFSYGKDLFPSDIQRALEKEPIPIKLRLDPNDYWVFEFESEDDYTLFRLIYCHESS